MKLEAVLLRELDETAGKLAQRLDLLRGILVAELPKADAKKLVNLDFDASTRVVAFYKSIEQLFDLCARQLMRAVLLALGEKIDGFAAFDAYNRLETLGAVKNAQIWVDLGNLRNRLAHSHPLNAEKQATAYNSTLAASIDLTAVVADLRHFLIARALLGGNPQ